MDKPICKIENHNKVARVHYDSGLSEYRVTLLVDGKLITDADYFTDDKVDAIQTAKLMVK